MATVPGAASRNAETSGAEPVIEARGLRMRYGSTDVLHGLDIRANRGEVLALLGPNGTGKTTTIEILEGFRKRSAGEVRVLGADPNHGDEAWRAQLGIVLVPAAFLFDGLGMRSALLPDAMSAAEIGESWRQVETICVLGVWAIVGFVVAPVVLRRMARRESGSSVAARTERTVQPPA